MTQAIVYLNGEYVPIDQASISVEDRGFLFADAVYEVTPVYGGHPLLMERHLERLCGNLAALSIPVDAHLLADVHMQLLVHNRLTAAEFAIVYLQVTRGVAPRGHAFPDPAVRPTVYAFARSVPRASTEQWLAGGSAITVADQRWARAEIKTTALLPNVLAQQAAVEADVSDAIFVRDGMALEGPHANLFVVLAGTLVTAPASNYILHGITRSFILELAAQLQIPVLERSFTIDELARADEVFLSSTVTEIRPILQIDGRKVGAGSPGPVTQRLNDAFRQHTASLAGVG